MCVTPQQFLNVALTTSQAVPILCALTEQSRVKERTIEYIIILLRCVECGFNSVWLWGSSSLFCLLVYPLTTTPPSVPSLHGTVILHSSPLTSVVLTHSPVLIQLSHSEQETTPRHKQEVLISALTSSAFSFFLACSRRVLLVETGPSLLLTS